MAAFVKGRAFKREDVYRILLWIEGAYIRVNAVSPVLIVGGLKYVICWK